MPEFETAAPVAYTEEDALGHIGDKAEETRTNPLVPMPPSDEHLRIIALHQAVESGPLVDVMEAAKSYLSFLKGES